MEIIEIKELWKGKGLTWLVLALGLFPTFVGTVSWGRHNASHVLALGLGMELFALLVLAYSRARVYRLTDRGIEAQSGILGRSVKSIPFSKIRCVNVSQSLRGRWQGYGWVVATTASESGRGNSYDTIRMMGVANPQQIKEEIEKRMGGR